MYSDAEIDELSMGQIHKLLKGGAVRVRCGSGMKVGLSAPQHKKLMSAHKKGKMMTLTMDPYQSQMHGQGFFGDIVKFVKSVPRSIVAPVEKFVTRQLPSALIHQGLPEVGSVLGGLGGEFVGGPMGGLTGAELGRMGGRKLAEETGRRTGYGVKKGMGTRIEDQQFSLRDVGDATRKLFGRGTRLEDQRFSLRDVGDATRKLFGGKVMKPKKGKGVVGDMMKMLVPRAKKVAKEVATKLARKAGSYAVHKALPMASERLGEMGGEYLGVQGGKDMGKRLGQMLEQEIAGRTGLGMKKRGRPKKVMTGKALMVAGVR